ncbi:MAG: repeat protein, partial [Pedosphaera sp.]|nr:repeat protein [Pedosphaera sp.]
MRKNLRIILLVMAALVLIVVGRHFYEQSQQPKYAGRTVSDWFEQYYRCGQWLRSDPAAHDEAAEAIRGIGTNAIPFLLEEAFNSKGNSALRTNLSKLMNSFPTSLNLATFASREFIGSEAADAIREIKPPARMVLPRLEKALAETNIFSYRQALYLLGCIDGDEEKGVPYLIAGVKNADPLTRSLALQSLKWIGPPAKAAVPTVMQILTISNSPGFRMSAVTTLGAMGSNAVPALGKLKEMLAQETRPYERTTIAIALYRIDDQQTEALKILLDPIRDKSQPARRQSAISQLWNLGLAARVAIPDLLEALEDESETVWWSAGQALKRLDVSQELYVPKLERKLKASSEDTRRNAASLLMQVAPGNAEAMKYLIALMERDSPDQIIAIESFRQAGPAAKAAIPVLRKAGKSGTASIRDAAAKAL